MFENLFNKNNALESENRQMNFAREQSTFQSGDNANSDVVHIQQQKEKTDLLKWQQDLGEEDRDLCLGLLGYYKTENGYEMIGKPKCNILFIQQVIEPILKSYNSRAMCNSNLSEKTLLMRLKYTSNNLARTMIIKKDQFEIEFKDFDDVLSLIKTKMVSAGYRAINGWTKRTDSTTFKRIESAYDNEKEQSKKKWGLF